MSKITNADDRNFVTIAKRGESRHALRHAQSRIQAKHGAMMSEELLTELLEAVPEPATLVSVAAAAGVSAAVWLEQDLFRAGLPGAAPA